MSLTVVFALAAGSLRFGGPAGQRRKPWERDDLVTPRLATLGQTLTMLRFHKGVGKAMPQFQKHVFICCNQRSAGHSRGCCDPDGSQRLRDLFKQEMKRRGLGPLVRANKAGCLDQCELGPAVVIYPQGIWYGGVQPEDVPRIVEKSLVGDEVIEELRIADELLNTKGGRAVSRDDSPGAEPKQR